MNLGRHIAKASCAGALVIVCWGCAQSADKAPQLNPTTGKHPANWVQIHWAEYIKDPSQCASCHGSTTDSAASGGIAKVSCFICHTAGVGHPPGWSEPTQHGQLGAKAAPSVTREIDGVVVPGAGFAYCTKCHGSTYDNGPANSCKSCHTKAPHPDRPWYNWWFGSGLSHTTTNTGNASECFKCHANGANSTLKPSRPAPVGTAAGCFNNTLCHGNVSR